MKRIAAGLALLAILVLQTACVTAPQAPGRANMAVAVGVAPPPLPWYPQTICPAYGYVRVPGYWGWGPYGFFWVPGAWIWPPMVGFLWTPGYWYWHHGAYHWSMGYWGPAVGFYGGIHYGHGYPGTGYTGRHWHHGHFYYNLAVSHVDAREIHSTYDRPVKPALRHRRVSYNGGKDGIRLQATARQRLEQMRARHIGPTRTQRLHLVAARENPALRTAGRGRPPTLADAPQANHPADFRRVRPANPRPAPPILRPSRPIEPYRPAHAPPPNKRPWQAWPPRPNVAPRDPSPPALHRDPPRPRLGPHPKPPALRHPMPQPRPVRMAPRGERPNLPRRASPAQSADPNPPR